MITGRMSCSIVFFFTKDTITGRTYLEYRLSSVGRGPKEDAVMLQYRALFMIHSDIYWVLEGEGSNSSAVVEVLCYKPEGHGFETRCGN
jgi:hypothetical protein